MKISCIIISCIIQMNLYFTLNSMETKNELRPQTQFLLNMIQNMEKQMPAIFTQSSMQKELRKILFYDSESINCIDTEKILAERVRLLQEKFPNVAKIEEIEEFFPSHFLSDKKEKSNACEQSEFIRENYLRLIHNDCKNRIDKLEQEINETRKKIYRTEWRSCRNIVSYFGLISLGFPFIIGGFNLWHK